MAINWRLSIDEVLFNLNDGEPVALFVDAEYQEMIATHRDQLPSIKNYFSLKPPLGGFTRFSMLMNNRGDFQPAESATGDGLAIIYTAAVAPIPRCRHGHRHNVPGSLSG